MKDNRQLTPAEKARNEKFEQLKKELAERGYEVVDRTIGVKQANRWAPAAALPIIIVLCALFFLCNRGVMAQMAQRAAEGFVTELVVLWASLLVLPVVHEGLHGITWAAFAQKRWKAISFGFVAKHMTPYCTCDEALKKMEYIIGAAVPTVVLGVIPAVAAVFSGSFLLFLIGLMGILGGGGDLLLIWKTVTLKAEGKEILCVDHPWQVGMVAFIK